MSDRFAPGGLLTLDLSTRTGWAYGTPKAAALPAYGTWLLGSSSSNLGRPWAALGDALGAFLAVNKPSRVIFEAPLPAMRQKQERIARLLIGMAVITELICFRRDVRCQEQSAMKPRQTLMGTARPKKDEIVAWCRNQGSTVVDDNAADAIVLWLYAATLS